MVRDGRVMVQRAGSVMVRDGAVMVPHNSLAQPNNRGVTVQRDGYRDGSVTALRDGVKVSCKSLKSAVMVMAGSVMARPPRPPSAHARARGGARCVRLAGEAGNV